MIFPSSNPSIWKTKTHPEPQKESTVESAAALSQGKTRPCLDEPQLCEATRAVGTQRTSLGLRESLDHFPLGRWHGKSLSAKISSTGASFAMESPRCSIFQELVHL